MRYRRSGQARNRLALLKQRGIHSQSALGSGNTCQFQEAPKSDGDLAIERISLRQSPVEIAGDDSLVLTDELDLPGLAIVRVGRQDRMAKDVEPGVGV